MPHHVLHLLGSAQPGGAGVAHIVRGLAPGLNRRGYIVHAWFLDGGGPLAGELEAVGARVRLVEWRGGAHDVSGAWRFWWAIRGRNFAIVHQHYGGRSARFLARRATGANVILHLHGRIAESANLDLSLVPFSAHDAGAVIATSRAVARQARGIRPYVVYPGVQLPPPLEATRLSPSTPGASTFTIGVACRLAAVKGIAHLIQATALLVGQFPQLRLEIAGDGPQRASLEQEVQRLGLMEHVAFLGWRADLAPVFARWVAFVQPSLEEGFGIAALEAMAHGLPVVATAVGGTPELVLDAQTGILVPPADPVALADALRRVCTDPVRLHKMGVAGQARVRGYFSEEKMVSEVADIYDRLLSGRVRTDVESHT